MTTTLKYAATVSGKEAFQQFTNRTVLSDEFGRRRKTEHRNNNGDILFIDSFKYETDKVRKPYEMTRTYPGKGKDKVVDTFTTHPDDNKDFVFYRIKSQIYKNGEKVRSIHYDSHTQAKTLERIFRRDKNTGLLLMTENSYDITGQKIMSSRRMVNLAGRYYKRTSEIDKKLGLQTRSSLRSTLNKNQKLKAIKAFFERLLPGKSA